MEQAPLVFGGSVIEIGTGDVGTVVEFDDGGRPVLVRYRDGKQSWHHKHELWAI